MRKIIFMMHISLDGFVAGPDGDMDWIVYNDEIESYGHKLHSTTDAALYGRNTYEMMNDYWPQVLADPTNTPGADTQGAQNHARWYDAVTKIVISKTLAGLERKNTIVIGDNIAKEITRIKQQPGKDIWLLGSPGAAQTLMNLGLIDEYWLNVNPIVLGNGKPLFANLDHRLNLKLLDVKALDGGVVALRYAPA